MTGMKKKDHDYLIITRSV